MCHSVKDRVISVVILAVNYHSLGSLVTCKTYIELLIHKILWPRVFYFGRDRQKANHISIVTFKNAVQTNGDSGFIFCPMVLKYSMLIYYVLPIVVSFCCNRQLKTSDFVKNVTFTDGHIYKHIYIIYT